METNIGIATFRKQDYKKILAIAEDKNSMNDTWQEWKKKKDRLKKDFEIMGIKTVDILVLPKELLAYCNKHDLKNSGETRARYVQEKVEEMFSSEE